MKKVLSIILSSIMIIGLFSVSAAATESSPISAELAAKLTTVGDNEKLDVMLTVNHNNAQANDTAYHEYAKEKSGLNGAPFKNAEDTRKYYWYFNKAKREDKKSVVSQFLAKAGLTVADMSEKVNFANNDYCVTMLPDVWSLTKAKIMELAQFDEIAYIGLYVDDSQSDPDNSSPTDPISPAQKITYEVHELIKLIPADGKISVWIWTNKTPDNDIDAIVYEKCGLSWRNFQPWSYYDGYDTYEEANTQKNFDYALYNTTRKNVIAENGEQQKALNIDLINQLNVSEQDVVFNSSTSPAVIVNLTPAQIYAAAELDEVISVDDYEESSETPIPIEEPMLKGNADGDGEVTILDATYIQRDLASIVLPSPIVKEAADVDGDGNVSIIDATCIQRYLVGLPYSTGGATTKPTVSLSFEDIDNVYEHNTVTATATGKAPFTYCYTIHGIFHANSEYGDDLGEYHRSEDQFEPGGVFFTTGYIDSNITTIPTHSITYGDPFELIVTVKDANGRESSPVTVSFYNR